MNWIKVQGTLVNLENVVTIWRLEADRLYPKPRILICYSGNEDGDSNLIFHTEALRDAAWLRIEKAIGFGERS